MTPLLQKALHELDTLPQSMQDSLASLILEKIAEAKKHKNTPLTEIVGKAKDLYATPQEVDAYVRNLKDDRI